MKINQVSLCGRVVADPESRTINGGESVVTSFRLASTPRHYDRTAREWVDGRTTWVTVSCWRHLARNVSVSLKKGMPVTVSGRLSSSEWSAPDGSRRSRLEVEADSVGVDLNYGTVDFCKVNWSEPREPRGPSEADELALAVERSGEGEPGEGGYGSFPPEGFGDLAEDAYDELDGAPADEELLERAAV